MDTKLNRRAVRGLAFRECEFCGRFKKDPKGNELNFQYMLENTSPERWDTHVFCSKICYSAWHSMNDGQ